MKFEEKVYGNTKEILATKNYEALGVMVNGTEDIPAGTIVGGVTQPTLANLQEPVEAKNTAEDGADAEGVLLHDVEVIDGQGVGTMVIRGNIDLNKLPEDPVEEVVTALETRILFIK